MKRKLFLAIMGNSSKVIEGIVSSVFGYCKKCSHTFFVLKSISLLCFVILLGAKAECQTVNASNYTFNFEQNGSLTTTGTWSTLVSAGQDDIASTVFNMGFPFFFNGDWYNNFSVNSNGVLKLGNTAVTNSTYAAASFPILNTPLIAPYYGDLATHSTGLVRAQVTGTAPNRVLVVQWSNMEIGYASITADGTFECRLYEANGKIEFVYGTMVVAGATNPTVVIGFSSSTFTNYLFTVNQNTYVTDNTSATSIVNTNVVGAITSLTSAADGQRKVFSFTPNYNFNIFTSLNTSWTAPCGVTTAYADCWGGGGGGGSSANTATNGGKGGGGGAYARGSHTLAAGSAYFYSVGAGGNGGPASSATAPTAGGNSWFRATAATNSAPTTNALGTLGAGGGAGINNSISTAVNKGLNTSSFGNLARISGGTGGAGGASGGGGGGGSAGTIAGADGAAGSTVAVLGGLSGGGGNGASGQGASNAASPGVAPGGGGGGSDDVALAAGGAGGAGRVCIWYPINTLVAMGPALPAICPSAASAAMGGSVFGGTGTWSGGAGTWTNATNPATATYTAGASESGAIVLTLTVTGGCGTTTATKTIVVNGFSAPSASATTSPICSGSSTSLTTTPSSAINTANNYQFATGTGMTLITSNFGPTIVALSSDDIASSVQTLPFTFNFEGTAYTQFSVESNGLLKLGSVAVFTEWTNSFTSTTNVPKLMGIWDDISSSTNGGVRWGTIGTSPNRIVVIDYRLVNSNVNAAFNFNFQVWLYETSGEIKFVYGAGTAPASFSCGIGGAASTNFNSVSTAAHTTSNSAANNTNSTWPGAGRFYSFRPPLQFTYSWSPATFLSATNVQSPTVTNATATTTYTATVLASGCSQTGNVTLTVNPTSVGGLASSGQTICTGTQPANITLSGNTGTIQWQWATDAVFTTPNNISGATASPLTSAQMGSLTATRYYRAVVTSGVCTAANSNVITVTVNAASVGGTASSGQTICTGTQPANITLSGNTGTIQWQWATDAVFTTPNNISGATASPLTSAQMGSLTATRYYRAVVTSGVCTAANSSVVTVTINPNNTASIGSINPILCVNAIMPGITHSTTGATGIANENIFGANGLPAGVRARWASNVITIDGTPTVAGSFPYSILLTGGCGTVNATGLIVVKAISATPTTTGPICSGSTSVSGTGINGSNINVIRSGITISSGTAAWVGSTWTITVAAVNTGDILTAKQTETGKCEGSASVGVTVSSCVGIFTSGGPLSFTACANIASAEQTFTVSGNGLSANITITAPTGFQISTTSGTGYASPLTLTQSGGIVNNTTIYVRMSAQSSSPVSANITCTSAGATTRNIAVSGTVNSAPPAITGSTGLCLNPATTTTTTQLSIGLPTGGTVTSAGGFNIHTFTSSGTFTTGSSAVTVDALLVGAGGGGGSNGGGGGGGGGVIYNTSQSLSLSTPYTITVGTGGNAAASATVTGSTGANSSFNASTALGGGGAASRNAGGAALSGGSGGGGAGGVAPQLTAGAGTGGQGNSGGTGSGDLGCRSAGAGGGGAGGAGSGGISNVGGNGGIGISNSITGSAVFYGGGGGGGTTNFAGCEASATIVPFTGSNVITCGNNTTLTDHAGAGSYLDNANGFTIIRNSGTGVITISGTSSGEASSDYVTVYRGEGTGGTLVGTYYMNTPIPTITSLSGEALTVQFVSDFAITGIGFSINVSFSGTCEPITNGAGGNGGGGNGESTAGTANTGGGGGAERNGGSGVVIIKYPAGGTWSSSNTAVATVNNSGLVTAVSAGSSTISYTSLNGCVSTTTVTVVNNPTAPVIGTITQPTCVTATGSVAFSGLPAGTWTVTVSPGGSTISGSTPTATFSGLSTGTYTFTVINANNCSSVASASATINTQPVVPTQPSVITGTLNPEIGVSQAYSVTNVAGLSYTWSFSGPNGWAVTSGQGSNAITATVGTANTTITVVPSNGCGAGTSRTVTTTIPQFRAKFISSNYGSSIWCAGTSRSVTVTVKNNGTATWTDGTPYDINIGLKWNTNGANWADYYYRQNAGSLAPGVTQTYTFASTQASNASAAGTAPNPPTYVSDLAEGSNNLSFDVLNESNCWFSNNSGLCGPGNTVYTTPAISIPSTSIANSNSPICSGTTLNLTATTVIGATYSWTGPNGYTSTAQNPTITNAQVSLTGLYSMVAVISGCSSAASSVSVTVNQSPGGITTQPVNANVSQGASTSVSVVSSGSGLTYQWQYATTSAGPWANVANGTPADVLYTNKSSATMTIAAGEFSTGNGNFYRCIVSSGTCNVTSNSSQITILAGNNSCAQAFQIDADGISVAGTLDGAVTEICSGTTEKDVWYYFTPSCTNNYTILLSNMPDDKNLFIYQSPCPTSCAAALYSSLNPATVSESINQLFNLGVTYYIRVVDAANTAGNFALTVTGPTLPVITLNPVDLTKPVGGSATFTVASTNSNGVQWELSTNGGSTWTNLSNGGSYAGVTTNSLTVSSIVASMDQYYYRARFTNVTTGCASRFSRPVDLSVWAPNSGADQTVCNGNTVNLGLTTTGTIGTSLFFEDFEYVSNFDGTGIATNWQFGIDAPLGDGPNQQGNRWAVSIGFPGVHAPLSGTRSLAVMGRYTTIGWSQNYGISNITDPIVARTPLISSANYTNMLLAFKWKCVGEAANDFGRVGYSTDGVSVTWFTTGGFANIGHYVSTSTLTNQNINLPSALNNSSYYIHFEWRNNASLGTQAPFYIDDIQITGTPSYTYSWSGPATILPNTTSQNVTVNTGGTFTGQITSVGGFASDQMLFTVLPLVSNGVVNSTAETICDGGDPSSIGFNTLPSGATGLFNYQWFYKDGNNTCPTGTSNVGWTSILGATAVSYDPPAGLTTTRTYAVMIDPAGSPDCGSMVWAGCRVVSVVSDPFISAQPLATQSLCVGGTASSLSVTASGGTPVLSYQWFSNTSNSYTGASSISGATSASYSPPASVAGTLYYFCQVSAAGSGCASITSNVSQLIINPNAAITSVTGTSAICIGATTTYSANGAVLGGTGTGAWSSNNTAVAIVNATTGVVTAVSAGTATITYTITGGCGGVVSANKTITINPNAAITSVTGTSAICIGATTTYTANGAVLGGGTGAWSSNNTAVASVNATTGVVSAVSAGTATITYTITGGCGGVVSANKTITINPNAAITSVTGTSAICIGATTTYTANGAVLGGTGTGAWSSNNTAVATVNATTGVVSGVSAGTATITYTITGGCGGTVSANKTITIHPNAAITSVTGTSAICIGATTTYTANGAVFGGTGTGAWSSNNTAVAAVNATTGVVTAVGAGTATITYTITGGCGGVVSANKTITIHPNAAITSVTGTSAICIGATTTYTANGAVLGGTGTGAWSSNNTAVAAVNATTGVVSAVSAGTATITYTITGGCGGVVSANKTITINPNAAITSVTGTSAICIGATTTYTANGAVFGGTGTGAWSSNNTAVATVNATTGVVSAVSAGTAIITYTITGGCGGTVSANKTITINPNAAITSVTGTSAICIGATTTYAANGVVLGGTGTGAWSSNNTAVAAVNATTGVVTAVGAGSATITYTITGGCGGVVSANKIITINPNAAITSVTGTSVICIGATATYTANGVVFGGTGTGAWSSNNTAVATVNATTGVVSAVSAGTATITYTITGGCGGTVSANQIITINPNAAITSVTGTSAIDIGATTTYTANGAVLGGTGTGAWSSNNTAVATVNATTGEVTAVSAGTATITYTITGGCGGTVSANQTITTTIVTPSFSDVSATSPLVIGQAAATGFKGQTITINGANFASNAEVTFNGVSAASLTVVNAGTITAVVNNTGASTTGNLTVTNPGTGAFASTSFSFIGYTSNGNSFDWSSNTSWLGSAKPAAGGDVNIRHTGFIGTAETVSLNRMQIMPGTTLTLSTSNPVSVVDVVNDGTIQWAGTTTLNMGGTLTMSASGSVIPGNGTIAYTKSGDQLLFSGSMSSISFNNLQLMGSGTKTMPSGADIMVNNLSIGSGVIFNPGTVTSEIMISGNISVDGSLNSTVSDFHFIGTADQSISLAGTGTVVVSALRVNKASGTLLLNDNVRVLDSLTMISGNINTQGNILEIGSSISSKGVLAYTVGYIHGKVRRWYSGTNAGAATGMFPVGELKAGNVWKNRNVQLNYTSAPSTGGHLTVEFMTVSMNANVTGTQTIIESSATGGTSFNIESFAEEGYWKIDNQLGTLIDGAYTIAITGENFTSIGTDLEMLSMVKRVSLGDWFAPGTHLAPTGDITMATLTRTGVSGFSNFGFGIAQPDVPLPVNVSSMSVDCGGLNPSFIWTSVQERDAKEFIVQQSADGKSWKNLDTVNAAGNSDRMLHYSFDLRDMSSHSAYVRLVLRNNDASLQAFNALAVSCKQGLKKEEMSLFPNPAQTSATVFSPVAGELELFNALGQKVKTQSILIGQSCLDVSGLPKGIYWIKVQGMGEEKLVVE